MIDSELDMTVHEDSWVKEHPVYCPVQWCRAHKLRSVRCGDRDGDYVGIHVARMPWSSLRNFKPKNLSITLEMRDG